MSVAALRIHSVLLTISDSSFKVFIVRNKLECVIIVYFMEIISIYIFNIDKKSTYRKKSIWRYFFNDNTGNIGRLKYREKTIYRNTDGAYYIVYECEIFGFNV